MAKTTQGRARSSQRQCYVLNTQAASGEVTITWKRFTVRFGCRRFPGGSVVKNPPDFSKFRKKEAPRTFLPATSSLLQKRKELEKGKTRGRKRREKMRVIREPEVGEEGRELQAQA